MSPKCVFLGSKQMGIDSDIQTYVAEGVCAAIPSFQFISPYISESVLNIASLHTNYLFGENDSHIQSCFSTKNKTDIKFGLYTRINNDRPTTILTFRDNVKWLKTVWKSAVRGNGKLNAGYQCFSGNKRLSTLTSLAFRKDAYFYPVKLTVTVNLNEEVRLEMIQREVCKGHFIWRKNGDRNLVDVPYNNTHMSIIFLSVEVGHSGIYSLECNNSDIEKAGFVQLIVRACPKGKYGNFCTQNCSVCLNGGICHDLNGKCICPPGFYGATCKEVCAPGSFGEKCEMNCSLVSTSNDQLSCKEALICLPHPYGCSCAAGFTGIFCNETCKPGTFGAGCSETHHCHCANGKNCNIYTGSCDDECAPNWYGEKCDFTLTDVTGLSFHVISSSTVNLTWRSLSELYSTAHVQYYIITYQRIGWRFVCNSSGEEKISQKNTTDTTFMLLNLKPFAIYNVHVRANIISNSDSFNQNGKSEVIVETSGTIPPPPEDFHIKLTISSTIFLVWSSAFPPTGFLDYYKVIYRDLRTNYTKADTLKNTLEDKCWNKSFEYCHAIRNLMPSHKYEIQLIAFNKNVSTGSEAVTITAETVPSDPVTNFNISILQHRKNEATIFISPGNANSSIYSSFLIVVDVMDEHHHPNQIDLLSEIHTKSRCITPSSYKHTYIAAKIHNIPNDGMVFTVGNKSCFNDYYNQPLQSGKIYRIGVAAIISICGGDFYSDVIFAPKTVFFESLKADAHSAPLSIVLGFALPLLIIVGILLVLLYLWKSKRYHIPVMKRKFIPNKGSSESIFGVSNEALDEMEIIETESLCEDLSNCIPLEELHDFIKQGARNNKIKKEFLSLPKGQLYPCAIAKLPDNKYKNRYGNILPYDHSRVKLDVTDGSDFIHANYIDGYKQTQKYIATQGPMYNTVTDFWSMIWKEKVSKIIMIANIMENGKCKCEKYWPDDVTSYGDIKITLEKEESFADFVIRTLNVSKDEKNREIKHFHFVSWPDHDVPLNTTPFMNFLKRVRNYNSSCSSPVVIHCSAGIGRTGTVILFENAFQMGIEENQVDLLGQLCCMRKQRMNIVENFDQYIFVYQALVEALCIGNTTIASHNFLKEYSALVKPNEETDVSTIHDEFEMLNDLRRQLIPKDIHSAYMISNQSKNRSMYILPSDRTRPLLGNTSYDSDYINAVFIDSYTKKDAFVATQYPLPETVVDFWRMIFTLKSGIIILLQNIPFSDSENPRFWPEHGSQHFGRFLVKFESIIEENDVAIIGLFVNDTESEEKNLPVCVKLLQIKSWSVDCKLPSDILSILEAEKFISACESELRNNVIVITCLDGVTACGVFCTFLHIIDQMRVAQEINIFQSVKCTRTNRMQFINTLEQYKFLFELVKAFLEIKRAPEWI
ncbi:receptor-type tyrosine-protein phosphatase T-like isoform X2 [Argiope bruennichi]|nr:receptor-type tyrosine-protein phosphatase T-like isoform X2 [Argiope bruennichi]